MKTIYSLAEFYDKVKEIAATVKEDYVHVEVKMGHKKNVTFFLWPILTSTCT